MGDDPTALAPFHTFLASTFHERPFHRTYIVFQKTCDHMFDDKLK